LKFIVLAASLCAAAASEFIVQQNTINLLIAIATVVGVVVAMISYLDKKIDHKIQNATRLTTAKFKILRAEISNLRELTGHSPLPAEPGEKEEAG